MDHVNVYLLDRKEECWCFECGERADVLAGPDHPPCDGNANYFCMDCLSPRAVVVDQRKPADSGFNRA